MVPSVPLLSCESPLSVKGNSDRKEKIYIYLMHHYLKKLHVEAILGFGNHFYDKFFLQYFEGCPRASSFHLNNLGNEVSNELQPPCSLRNCKLD